MRYPKAFWEKHSHLSGEELGRELHIDGGSARRLIREAKAADRAQGWDLVWFDPKTPKPNKILTGMAVFDWHYPHHHERLTKNILALTKDLDPDVFVRGGDNGDYEVISHWVENKRGRVEGMRLLDDYKGHNETLLDPLNEILRPDCRKIEHDGNHELWVQMYLDEHPELKGLLEIDKHLHLDGWERYEYGEISKVGKLHITHGEYINIHNALKTVQVYGRNIIYGHGHSYQAHTLTTPIGAESHMGVQIPCACTLNPHYRRNHPNSWLNGFAVFYVYPDGDFNLYPVISVDGSFIAPNGVLYE